ncbi:hypothetical protein ACFQWB_03465 [Paenibacillus thermoaerophilus]|uniref:LysR family transcriptional regulator n=1 Tax=Paenibacillus thermoaerophilus TaxID=1215385 RepID=A0ABW2V1X5_9BACL|nr:hypothetical protein [Paenibacillus thermoaerophilus]TMV10436.1 hypothetical protein FE781_14055 [Paenibacillus thermoaerophilus]
MSNPNASNSRNVILHRLPPIAARPVLRRTWMYHAAETNGLKMVRAFVDYVRSHLFRLSAQA